MKPVDAVSPAADHAVAVSPWEPARHPRMKGFFCLVRTRAGQAEHHMADESVSMFWSRAEAAAAALALPAN